MQNDRPTEKRDARSYWRFQLFAWGFLGGYTLLYIIANPYLWQWGPIILDLARVGIAAVLSQLIIKTALSRNWLALTRVRLLVRGLGACALGGLVLTLIILPWTKEAYGATEPGETVEPFWPVIDYISNAGMLIMWGGFFLAFHFHNLSRRSELDRVRLQVAARDLQLSTLRSQLNPHFLFNSFSLLRTLVQRDPQAARDSITHLAEMMRHSLSLARYNTISIASELDFVESYLALERQRFEDRLRLSQSVPDDLRHQKIPSMLLYTLVENAVKYGIVQSIEGVDVSYSIWAEAGHLCLRVTNGGKLLKTSDSTGTGLENIRRRLELLYGDEATLTVTEHDGLVVAEARWPTLSQEGTP